jgi:hypothetical protein
MHRAFPVFIGGNGVTIDRNRDDASKEARGDAETHHPFAKNLAAQTEALDGIIITLHGCQFEIVEEFPATGDHSQEAATGGVIFDVAAQMARQVIDALGEQGDLKVGAAGVLFVLLEGADVYGGCFAHVGYCA